MVAKLLDPATNRGQVNMAEKNDFDQPRFGTYSPDS